MQTRNLIGGDWVGSDSGRTFDVHDPATDAVIASVPECAAAETDRAIESAARAQERWAALPARERAGPVRRIGELMIQRRENLARLLTSEQGKPLDEARGEIAYAASFLDWAAGEAQRIYGRTVPPSTPDKRILVLRQPVGVAAAITPWNFPSAMITRKLGPALAAGCAMVVKPAEQTPLSAIALGELAIDAGLPPGLFNIVTGSPEPIAQAFLSNPSVRLITFTGSTEVGRLLMRGAAQNTTRVALELGGHAPFIVFDDADLDQAVAGAMATKFRNMGQTCICANRFYIHERIHDELVSRLVEQAKTLRVGVGTEDGVRIGPLINDAAIQKVQRHVEDAVNKGATVLTGGKRVCPGPGLTDRFYAPTVLTDCTPEMLVFSEETFGPVAPICRFEMENEVIRRANDTSAGLAAYFFTRDSSRLMRVAEALEYGIVGANDATPSTAQAPFGGFKQSGIGREGGAWAMDEYLETKYVSWKL